MSCGCSNTPTTSCPDITTSQIGQLDYVAGIRHSPACPGYEDSRDFLCRMLGKMAHRVANAGQVGDLIPVVQHDALGNVTSCVLAPVAAAVAANICTSLAGIATPTAAATATTVLIGKDCVPYTVAKNQSVTFSNATKILTITESDGTSITVDLSALATDINVSNASFDPVTSIITITETDGSTYPINLAQLNLCNQMAAIITAPGTATLGAAGTIFIGKDCLPYRLPPAFSFRVTTGTTIVAPAGGITVNSGDALHFWSAGGLSFNVTLGSAVVEGKIKFSTDAGNVAALGTDGGLFVPASPPSATETSITAAAGNGSNTVVPGGVNGHAVAVNTKLSVLTPGNALTLAADGLAVGWTAVKALICNNTVVSTNPMQGVYGYDAGDCMAVYDAQRVWNFIQSVALCGFGAGSVGNLGSVPSVFLSRTAAGCVKSVPIVDPAAGNSLSVTAAGLFVASGASTINTAGNSGVGSLVNGDTLTITGLASKGMNVVLAGDTFTITFDPLPATFACSTNYLYATKDAGGNVATLTGVEVFRDIAEPSLNRNGAFNDVTDAPVWIRRRGASSSCDFDLLDVQVQRDYFKAAIDNGLATAPNISAAGANKTFLKAEVVILEDVLGGGATAGAGGILEYVVQTSGLYYIACNVTVTLPIQTSGDLVIDAEVWIDVNGGYKCSGGNTVTIPASYIGAPTKPSFLIGGSSVVQLTKGDKVHTNAHFSPGLGLTSANPFFSNLIAGGYGSSLMEVRYLGTGKVAVW